ncbi:MAG: DNA-directed RNA polymerase subunit N [Methermicoccaceae archaeon]
MIPVRCFTCGRVISSVYEEYAQRIKAGQHPKEAMDELGVTRYCCRRMLLAHVRLVEDFSKYK